MRGVHSLHSFGYTEDTKLVLDLPNRRLIPEFAPGESPSEFFKEPANLRLKAFCLVCYLALRRTDGSDGWVDLQEVVERVPRWRGLSAPDAGKQIYNLRTLYKWFGKIEWGEITRGPYRLGPEVDFIPDRDAINLFLASMSDQRRETRQLTDTELEAYHLLAQSGVYAAPVVDLIQQRLGNAAQLPEPHERLSAYRVLVTLAKNRGKTGQARTLANEALPLARQLGRSDDIAYLLDQLGCIAEIEGVPEEAIRRFEEEIDFLTNSENPRSTFHLVGAYRGLAMALRSLGKMSAARSAIRRSRACAEATDNEEGLRLAALVETQLEGRKRRPGVVDVLQQLPAGHPIAYVMLLNTLAEGFFERGNRAEGQTLLRLAHRNAQRFGIEHAVRTSRNLAKRFRVKFEKAKTGEASKAGGQREG